MNIKRIIYTGFVIGLTWAPFTFVYANTCYTKCVGFVQFECGSNKVFGACVGAWGCPKADSVSGVMTEGKGAHECLDQGSKTGEPVAQQQCTKEVGCAPGYRCAIWATKKNECVKTCSTDKDCSPLKCKKPLGTKFKRCT